MAIPVAPKWVARAKAYPTARGWTVNRGKGKTEVIKSANFTADQIAEWHASQGAAPVAPAPQMLSEAPAVERPLHEEEVRHHYGSFGGNDEEE